MKVWVKFFYKDDDEKYQDILGSDGVGYLDARYSIRNLIEQCISICKNKNINKPDAFQIHRSNRFSVERPITEIIPVK
jgi:hypothetical protein